MSNDSEPAGGLPVMYKTQITQTPKRPAFREHAAGAIKVILLTGGLLGGLWLLQMIAKT